MKNKQSNKVFRFSFINVFAVAAIIYFIYYLYWRATYTLNPENLFLSWLLWAAEAFGVFAYLLFVYVTHNIEPNRKFTTAPRGLKVDVFVPTYNEEVEVLEPTLIGCVKMRYPHTTYVLDDGNRPWVKELADRLGVKYIARPSHEHHKAGNINYALQQTKGDFIVLLDADMVPQPQYIERTLGYFLDEKLALIQMPQEFYNQDSIQHASKRKHWHEQSLFFRVIQPGKNYTNSAFWCGSPSIIRRAALESVNGVATETITEDIHTSVRLHSQGWQTYYLNEVLAYGIAPQTINSFLVQRLRWAQGTMQLYRSAESPLWIRGLTFKQRLSYFSSFLAYLESFQKLTLILIPVLILGLGVFPMRVAFSSFLLHWIPFFLFNYFANQLSGRGYFNYFKTEMYNLLKMMIFIQSTLTLVFNRPLQFKVTPKSVDSDVYHNEHRALRLYEGLFALLAATMIFSIVRLFLPNQHELTVDAFAIAFFWAAYNAFIILLATQEIFKKRHERKQYRFPVNVNAELISGNENMVSQPVQVIDLSTGGCGFIAKNEVDLKDSWALRLFYSSNESVILPIKRLAFQRKNAAGKFLIGTEFADLSNLQQELLYEYLFVILPPLQDRQNGQTVLANPFQTLPQGEIKSGLQN